MYDVELEVIVISDSHKIVKASYKDSVYYLLGEHDITDYVTRENISTEVSELDSLKQAVSVYLKKNPHRTPLKVPQYELLIVDHPDNDTQYLRSVGSDIFRMDDDQLGELEHEVLYFGCSTVLKGSYEMVHTYACIIETANMQLGESLCVDIVESSSEPESYGFSMPSMELIETLIRRDFPTDM